MCHPGRQVNATEFGTETPWVFVNQTFIQEYNCSNPCNSEHVGHRTQFRGRDSLLLLNMNQTWGKDRNQAFETFVGDATQTSFIALPIVVIQGLYTILFGEKTPHEVRNTVFRFLAGHRKSWDAARPIKLQPWRRYAAQFFALLIYTLAVLALIVCPILFVVNVVAIELTLTDYHDSEDPWLIGQWSPIAAVILAVLAAFLSEYWERGTNRIRHWLLGAKADRLHRRHHTGALTRASTGSKKPDIATNKDGNPLIERRSSEDPGLTRAKGRENTIDRIVGEWRCFLAFLHNPVEESLEEMRKRNAATDDDAAHHNEGEDIKDFKPSTAIGESSELMLPSFHQHTGSSGFHSLPTENEDDDRWKEMTMIDIENVAAHPGNAHAKTWAGKNSSWDAMY